MPGKFALIIGNSRYDDSSLGRLKAPEMDAQGLERVLRAPEVGHFDDVTTLLNEGCASVRKAIARFYDQRHRDDLLLLYFSGHGIKDEQGHLYLALRDTESGLLAGTALETAFITARMDRSFSKRQVLVLDCCHSGAFANGTKGAQGVSVGTAEAFEGTGLGRVVLTATDSTQYAWEGDQVIGDAESSLFTHFLIDGLETGAADQDADGVVTVDELYDYVREQVVNASPRQTPHKWTYRQEGEIVLAQNPFVKRSTLPPEIEEAKNSKLSSLRLEAIRHLDALRRGHDAGRATAALAALKELSLDDSRKVANAALAALKVHDEEERERSVEVEKPSPIADVRDSSDIFISYAHEDHEKARALAGALAARGWRVWWDRKIAPGEAYDVVIERELGSCKCAIVLWSARSVGATWVRNEARRAARRKVLVPILIDPVETPLEFDNLQTADLTTWKEASEAPELEPILDRILALSPIPSERRARSTVDEARRDFKAGRRDAAIASLEQFRPAHDLVSRALAELRREAERIDEERAETRRQDAEAARLAADQARIEQLRQDAIRIEAQQEQLARKAVEDAGYEFAEGGREMAIASLERFRPPHELVARALVELRAEAARIERERADAARRENEARASTERGPNTFERNALLEAPAAAIAFADVDQPTHSWLNARAALAAAAVLLILVAGALLAGVWPRRVPDPQPNPTRRQIERAAATSPLPAASPQPRTPAVEAASAPAEVVKDPPSPSPAEAVEAQRGAAPDLGVAKAPVESAVSAPAIASRRIEELRTRARFQMQAGQRADALNSAVEGLRIDSRDVPLRGIVTSLLREAESIVEQRKRDANAVDAGSRAETAFGEGVRNERNAARLRRAGKLDAATRSYWLAADQFRTAAAEAQQVEAQEEAEARLAAERSRNRRKETESAQPTQAPTRPKPSLDERANIERELVDQTLRHYEAAYASLKADSVRAVYPQAPLDQLSKDFASYRSYRLKVQADNYQFVFTDTLTAVVVTATVVHDFVLKSGERSQSEKTMKIQLEKQGQTWTIKQIR